MASTRIYLLALPNLLLVAIRIWEEQSVNLFVARTNTTIAICGKVQNMNTLNACGLEDVGTIILHAEKMD